MGWERKRGKLEEFNELLTGRGGASFSVRVDPPTDLASVRYVLTLDADTRLPPGAARELVAAFRHPLNRPVLDPHADELRAGYTVLQPRLEADAATMLETAFARVMTGESGVDLYAQTVSNVHHDLFGRAIFGGKGLYEVDAFERRLRGRVPENRLLSHDLFEGVHGRVGLVSDVVLFEQVPANAVQHALRLHRWVRGDWQLLPWLVARRPLGRHGRLARGCGRSTAGRSPTTCAAASTCRRCWASSRAPGWPCRAPPRSPPRSASWRCSAARPARGAAAASPRGRRAVPCAPLEAAAHDARLETARWAVTVALLPYLALVTSDAITRALYRVYVSRRGLLQWTTAAHAARTLGTSLTLRAALRHMWGAVALALRWRRCWSSGRRPRCRPPCRCCWRGRSPPRSPRGRRTSASDRASR
jgi:cyclic beta-1,2-glucan synthetase